MTSLVADPSTMGGPGTGWEGAGVASDIADTVAAIQSKDWVSASVSAGATVVSAAATIVDPIGSALSAGIGWVIEHLEPLKEWLQKLTGDDAAVAAFAQTWRDVAAHLDTQAMALRDRLADLSDQSGEFIEALRQEIRDNIQALSAFTGAANAMGTGFEVASHLVAFVYEVVRDAIADIVAKAIVWALEVACTLFLGTPVVIAQVVSTVADWAARVFPKMEGLIDSAMKLYQLAEKLDGAVTNASQFLAGKLGLGNVADAATSQVDDLTAQIVGSAISGEEIGRRIHRLAASNVRFADAVGGAVLASVTNVVELAKLYDNLKSTGATEAARLLRELFADTH
ncbi:hypothetical protein [Demequina sp.]|uniref:hypothetical protein n=1 Tax=Demequina sp. TaxID=2050685 RepID=UPI003A86F107